MHRQTLPWCGAGECDAGRHCGAPEQQVLRCCGAPVRLAADQDCAARACAAACLPSPHCMQPNLGGAESGLQPASTLR